MSGSPNGRARGWKAIVARTATSATVITMIPLVAIGIGSWLGVLQRLPDVAHAVISAAALPLLVVFVVGLLASRLPRPDPPPPVEVRSPVLGRWRAMNSPATRVPSHGTHLLGQTYAIDLVHEPAPGARPAFGGWHPARSIHEYPALGQPVVAPIDGRVVAARRRARDHRCRSSWLGLAYLMVESAILSLRGTGGILGNHVVIEVDGGGRWVTVAHLRRGSVRVQVGDRVTAGQQVGEVGNSGNSSEPHVHLQVTDHRRLWLALGVPFVFTDVVLSNAVDAPAAAPEPAVPAHDTLFHAVGEAERRVGR